MVYVFFFTKPLKDPMHIIKISVQIKFFGVFIKLGTKA